MAVVVLGMTLAAPPAMAEAPTMDFLGNGYFCRGWKTGSVTCGGVYQPSGGRGLRILFYKAAKHPIGNISYRACAESPSGKIRCVPRRTRHKRRGKDDRDFFISDAFRITMDRFRFASAFPHRQPGIYKLTFRRDGKQWGQVIRLRVTQG